MFAQVMHNYPDWKAIFAPNGCLLKEGDVLRRTALSRTLAAIADEGPDVFYTVSTGAPCAFTVAYAVAFQGPIAEAIIARIQATGGIMTLDDLAQYEVKVDRALEGSYRGRKIYTTHAPTSGPVLLHMFNLLEQFDDFVAEGRTSLNVHRIIEIMKCTTPFFNFFLEYIAHRTS